MLVCLHDLHVDQKQMSCVLLVAEMSVLVSIPSDCHADGTKSQQLLHR